MIIKDEIKKNLIEQLKMHMGTRPPFYLKFCSCKKYAEDICNGNLYANTPIFFRQQEIKSKKRGQGDSFELISYIEAQKICILNEDGSIIFSAPGGNLKIQFKEDDLSPIVCFVGIELSEMNFIDITETYATFKFPFSKEEYLMMNEEFGEYCVIIGARELEKNIRTHCIKHNTDYIFDKIEYTTQQRIDRIQAFNMGSKTRFLYKNEDLSYQREYRFVAAYQMPCDHYIKIGRLTEAKIIKSSELKNIVLRIDYVLK